MPLDPLNLLIADPPRLPSDPMELDQSQFNTELANQGTRQDTNAIWAFLSGYPPMQLTDVLGRDYMVLGQPLGENQAFIPPFLVTVTENHVFVRPGVISNAWEVVTYEATLGGTANVVGNLAHLTKPSSSSAVLWARIEVEPVATETSTDYFEITSVTTVTAWDIDFHDISDAQIAQINPATGTVIQNGIYYRPIARVTSEGEVGQHAIGPMEAKFCEGRLSILPGPVATINVGLA